MAVSVSVMLMKPGPATPTAAMSGCPARRSATCWAISWVLVGALSCRHGAVYLELGQLGSLRGDRLA